MERKDAKSWNNGNNNRTLTKSQKHAKTARETNKKEKVQHKHIKKRTTDT